MQKKEKENKKQKEKEDKREAEEMRDAALLSLRRKFIRIFLVDTVGKFESLSKNIKSMTLYNIYTHEKLQTIC